MKPLVALVGRPNVGKSTLFNRLTRSRDALVSDLPGVTRDRLFGTCRHEGSDFLVVDTGGLESASEGEVAGLAAGQARRAIEEADLVVFLVDARLGLHPEDQAIAEELRRLDVPVVVAVNKAEGRAAGESTAEFHALGLGEPVALSAAHGAGVGRLLSRIGSFLPPVPPEEESLPGIRIAILGRPNVGKSTLINALLGEERVITYDRPGTTRDAVHSVLERAGTTYTLVDTAGVRRRSRSQADLERFSAIKAIQAMEAADLVVLLLDAREGVTEQDARLARLAQDAGRGMLIVLNKWDGLEEEQKERVRRTLHLKLGGLPHEAPILRISALHGTNVGHLLEEADRVYAAYSRELPTTEVNRVLRKATEEHPPPFRGGFRPKLRYAHQGGRKPPRIVVHGTRARTLDEHYLRYLRRRFREAFGLQGVPLRLELRTQESPYKGRARHKVPPKSVQRKKGKKPRKG